MGFGVSVCGVGIVGVRRGVRGSPVEQFFAASATVNSSAFAPNEFNFKAITSASGNCVWSAKMAIKGDGDDVTNGVGVKRRTKKKKKKRERADIFFLLYFTASQEENVGCE